VKVGDVIGTETGENWGPVQSSVTQLVTQGTLPATISGSESQLVTVAIVDWGGVTGATTVKVLGFAELWIDGISKNSSTQILTVQFVRYIADTATGGGGSTAMAPIIRHTLRSKRRT
jgi:hypothetical protein